MLRANGVLFPVDGMPDLSAEDTETLFLKLSGSKERLEVLWKEKGVDFAYEEPGLARYRVNAVIQRSTVNLTLRRIHATIPKFEELGLPSVCKDLATRKKGLILVTGPVNSGKSTTLAAMIEYINQTSSRRIITIEDPVEYVYSSGRSLITQRELGSDVPSFAEGLRSALRQDPDVILVGELRDIDTVAACLTAAETGHMVMSTLHTPNAYQAIDRLVDVFPSEQQHLVSSRLASLLEAVLYQMLVPTIDGSREVLATEIMLATPAIRALIRDEKIHQIPNTIHTSRNSGMQTMDQSLADLYEQKLISKEELLQRCLNLTEVQRQLGLSL
jgi:twitching motility protein PilT